jgi:hypothetical protein
MSIRCSDDLLYSWETKSPKKCGILSGVCVCNSSILVRGRRLK